VRRRFGTVLGEIKFIVMGLFDKFKYSLAKTRAVIVSQFVSQQWSEADMERGLLAADFGPKLTQEAVGVETSRIDRRSR
jgi:hypothetical protein